jgi:trans-2,3-dihydro-3-hydroxyanthranilate isomerase
MNSYAYVTLDVFTAQRFGGNQLAVILDAHGLSDTQMQTIAKEFNFSETTFVLPPKDPANTAQVRIFTPHNEMPFAGHPTVGTAFALATLNKIAADATQVIFEEGVGLVPVEIMRNTQGVTRCTLTAPRNPEMILCEATSHTLASVYNLDHADFNTTLPFSAMSSGNALLITPLVSRDALARCTLDLAQLKKQSAATRDQQLYPCVIEAASRTAYVRMFAPNHGVLEDAATGSAAATFAGYLAKFVETTNGTHTWTIHQGIEMGRPSEIALQFERVDGAAKNVRVGGSSVLVMQGTLLV